MAALMAVIGPLGFAMRGSSWMAGSAPCRLSGLAMASGSKELEEDAESNARLMAALGISEDAAIDLIYEEPDGVKEKSKDIPSHQQLDLDESGQPLQLRFAYVDEASCIGCTYCADVARNTFYMNEQAGRARVYAQGQDSPEVLLEAMESCPVNCISFVDHEDLVILEV
jgi:ferredoxin